MKRRIIYLFSVLLGILLSLMVAFEKLPISFSAPVPSCKLAGQILYLDIADEDAEFSQGLSGRDEIAENEAMYFMFPSKQVKRFWMKDMKFPLDIIWLDGDIVVHIDKDLAPEGSEPSRRYQSPQAIDGVLEVRAGWSERYGLEIGDRVTFNIPKNYE